METSTARERDAFNVTMIMERACRLASHSWEYGTAAEALIELHNPELSVFSQHPFPGGKLPLVDVEKTPGLKYAKALIRTGQQTLIDGDGSAGDPASLGVVCLLIGQTHKEYAIAAESQARFILEKTPRFKNGAISHRENVAELWADFTYMVPPFLSYLAIATNNESLMRQSQLQCHLYEEILRARAPSKEPSHLWRHIVGPEAQDLGLWSTGNGWAVAGICRTLATMKKCEEGKYLHSEKERLQHSIMDILDGAMLAPRAGYPALLCNYLDDDTWFGEIAGTALLGAVAYRMVVLAPLKFGERYAIFAESCWEAIKPCINPTSGAVVPTSNELDWKSREPSLNGSSEGQSFTVMLFAARRDYMARHAGK
ncbi:MAG: hypothetical protein Q9164_004899 [Protoblastenia rupestris]